MNQLNIMCLFLSVLTSPSFSLFEKQYLKILQNLVYNPEQRRDSLSKFPQSINNFIGSSSFTFSHMTFCDKLKTYMHRYGMKFKN